MVESFYQCARCRPEYKLCGYCFAIGKIVAGELSKGYAPEGEEPHGKEPPVIYCMSCLNPGHQGGRKCRWLKEQCKNCGHKHIDRLICKDVEFLLEHEGNPCNIPPKQKTKDTPVEDLCTNCLNLRHHSRMPCEKNEPVLVTENVPSEEESSETVCVTCLVTGHQSGKE